MAKKPIVEIDCRAVWRQVSNYIDGDLAEDVRAAMALHFKNCAHCSAILDGTRNVVKLVGDGKAFDIPSGARSRLYGKLDEHLGRTRSKKRVH